MDVADTGLVLEGGGLRGVYTSGVLQYLMERDINFRYVIGVSMGACNGVNYISRQIMRNRIVNTDYINDHRYFSYRRLLRGGELFGMDFIFDTIPNRLVPFDYRTFSENRAKYTVVVTDCITGEALYYEKSEMGDDMLTFLRASSSLPFIAKPVHCRGKVLMDGGLSDSIPIRKSIADGNRRNVVILTQPAGYRKKGEPLSFLAPILYRRYRGLGRALSTRHTEYNSTISLIERLERDGEAFVIRPATTLEAGRIETDRALLLRVYDQGYRDASDIYGKLLSFLVGN